MTTPRFRTDAAGRRPDATDHKLAPLKPPTMTLDGVRYTGSLDELVAIGRKVEAARADGGARALILRSRYAQRHLTAQSTPTSAPSNTTTTTQHPSGLARLRAKYSNASRTPTGDK